MKISTQTRYALRLLVELSMYEDDQERITSKEISTRQNISEKYLESIAAKLARARYINSMKGVGGGYKLQRPATQIRVGEIMELMETTYFDLHCSPNPKKCPMYKHCAMHQFWSDFRDEIDKKVYSVTIADLCTNQRQLNQDFSELSLIDPMEDTMEDNTVSIYHLS